MEFNVVSRISDCGVFRRNGPIWQVLTVAGTRLAEVLSKLNVDGTLRT